MIKKRNEIKPDNGLFLTSPNKCWWDFRILSRLTNYWRTHLEQLNNYTFNDTSRREGPTYVRQLSKHHSFLCVLIFHIIKWVWSCRPRNIHIAKILICWLVYVVSKARPTQKNKQQENYFLFARIFPLAKDSILLKTATFHVSCFYCKPINCHCQSY